MGRIYVLHNSKIVMVDYYCYICEVIHLLQTGRGIYGNAYAFPGGVSWAIMAAKICQLCSNRAESLIPNFFLLFYFW